jgi:hypothetical protein
MGWVAKLFKLVPKRERKGISLGRYPYWEVMSPRDFPSLLRALTKLIPQNSILYFEDGYPRGELKAFFEKKSVPEISQIALGTTRSRPKVFHVPATPENLIELAKIAEGYAEPEVAIHFHVYKEGKVLLEWYDAFSDDPMYLSGDIPESALKKFCDELSIEYRKYIEDAPPLRPRKRK